MRYVSTIPSSTSEMRGVLDWLESYLPEDIDSKLHHNILLTTQEILSNAVIHGNENSQSKSVHVSLDVNSKLITVSITDEGGHLVPLPSKNESKELDYLQEGGRGVKLAVLLSDEISSMPGIVTFKFKI